MMQKLLCQVGIHKKEFLFVRLKVGDRWIPQEKYWVCKCCKTERRVW